MEGLLNITTPELVEVVYDPLRSRILRRLSEPKSIKQLAGELQTKPGPLYYHVHLLEDHGLVAIADQQLSRTKLERLYVARYHSFRLDRSMRNNPVASSNGAVIGQLEDIVDEYCEALASWDGPPAVSLIMYRHKRLSGDRAREFSQQARALLEEYFGVDTPDEPDGIAYGHLWIMQPFTQLPPSAVAIEQNPDAMRDALREFDADMTRPSDE